MIVFEAGTYLQRNMFHILMSQVIVIAYCVSIKSKVNTILAQSSIYIYIYSL